MDYAELFRVLSTGGDSKAVRSKRNAKLRNLGFSVVDIRTAMACLNGTLQVLNEETNEEVINYFINKSGRTSNKSSGTLTPKAPTETKDDDNSDDEVILINRQPHPMNMHIVKYLGELKAIYSVVNKDDTDLSNCIEWLKIAK